MMQKVIRMLLAAVFYWPAALLSQPSGTVTDPDGEPLAFVTIMVNDSAGGYLFTDIEGHFYLKKSIKVTRLHFRYVGFESKNIAVNASDFPIQVVLRPTDYGLESVDIIAGENPADLLMKKAIANRKANNPESRPAFTCKTYNKIGFEFVPNREAFLKHRDSKKHLGQFDHFEKNTEQHEVFLLESVTERHFRYPNLVQEKVLLNRISGFQNSGIVAVANAVQPFTFYGDYLPILGKNFVNPVSPGSTKLYFFNIEDTLYIGRDTVWTIAFKPRKGKVFMGLKGVLNLHSNGYAIQSVRAKPAFGTQLLDLTIEQSYSPPEVAGAWFPNQLNFEIEARKYPSPYLGLRAKGHSFITEAQIDSSLHISVFNPEQPLYITDNAETANDSAWAKWRLLAPLTRREANTYIWLDSLTEARNLDLWMKVVSTINTGVWPIKEKVGINIRHLVRLTDFEGIRLGVGFTNAQHRPLGLARKLEWNVYGGYGIKDKQFKYGAHVLWRIHRGRQTQFRVGYQKDLGEPGAVYEFVSSAMVDRSFYASRMDGIQEVFGQLASRIWNSTLLQLTVREQWLSPLGYTYNYAPIVSEAAAFDQFRFSEVTLYFRWAYGERLRTFLGNDAASTNKAPAVELAYTRGLHHSEGLTSNQSYSRWAAAIYQSVFIRRLGRFNWRFEAGQVSADAPLAKLFTLNQSGGSNNFFTIRNTFQSLPDTLFLHNRYASAFLSQEIGPVLYQKKYSAPFLSLLFNSTWGQLTQPGHHRDIGFRSVPRPTFESGIRLDNLLRINYINIGYLGFGTAIFYRWGELGETDWQQNISIRLATKFTF